MRIGIVNDSAMAREALRRVVASAPGLDVVWTAVDGADGVAKVRADLPDLVLMDLFMPRMDGVESTRRIMTETPCPILIVTATVSGHIDKVYRAMGHGALDAVDTPVIGTTGDMAGGGPLLRKIEVIGKLIGKYQAPPAATTGWQARTSASTREPLLLLGASTGGPFAVAEILTGLPPSWSVCTILVQHVDADFAPGLGSWLTENTGKRVELITEGTRPSPGRFLLAATGDHLLMTDEHRLVYSEEPKEVSYRPSVDVFFQSVARCWPGEGSAVLLTGMGRDGAEGLLALRRRGWRTIAQDEASSVVWGMPRAAVEIGAAELVAPLDRIASAIVQSIPGSQPR
ncbi:MAG: chemotaxis response regulator protein-glutamate methylesterase [Paludisphaera borealis]|uniref:chemotaxis response regulator protein-glutamate methylesterase n=1 Tax=Paludisphaera borealis TaxID=1387353 RepID=UPI002846F12B|nr:chemotaxis response regulator protein-glutamate methylesterase [Paludisphaera borealis]MDR3622595.1 chemotaxis response regulator protein-glutamate methylesterase [Paludisphaera borealis]